MNLSEIIYYKSPRFIQDLMVSLYGLGIKRQRYGEVFYKTLKNIRFDENLSLSDIEELRKEKLRNIMSISVRQVQKYKDLYGSVHHCDVYEDLKKFPLLEKQELREDTNAYINQSEKEFSRIYTSGSTGTPLVIEVSNASVQMNYAFFWQFLNGAGIEVGDKNVTFAGRKIIPDSQHAPPFWRKNYFMQNMLFSSYHISEENIPYYIDALSEFSPKYIDSYPSAIYEIAEYINRKSIDVKINLKGIVTSSETLLPYQRKSIEEAFKCKVYDQYGSAEMCVFAFQCKYGTYHIHPEYCYVEVVSDSGEVLPNGEIGNLVCTGFINERMPLIRYVIGDTGSVIESECACGCKGQVLAVLEGRKDDVIITPNGQKVGRLDPIYKGLTGIKESQIIQTKLDEVTIYIVKADDYSGDSEQKLRNEMRLRLGDKVNVRIECVQQLNKTDSGKFRSVISLLDKRVIDKNKTVKNTV